jgi:DNA invertase Pin-like site-specific DNA recombinase
VTHVFGYARVSTREQARSGLGLAAQRAAIESEAQRRGWRLVDVREEIASGAKGDRPVLREIVDALRPGETLAVAKLDRLTRSLLDFASIVREAQERRWSLVVLDQGFELDTPSGRAMAGMLAVFAEYERELIGQRVRDALRSMPRERRNGRPCYPTEVLHRARSLRDSGMTMSAIAQRLTSEGVSPPRGGRRLYASTVSRMLELEGS